MDFKDIPLSHMKSFLKINHKHPTKDFYKIAIELINSDEDVIVTKEINYWLTAFEYKHMIKPTKATQLKCLLDFSKQETAKIYMYLRCFIDDTNYLDQLPLDMISELLHYVDLRVFKQLSSKINHHYKQIMSNKFYKKQLCEALLRNKGYDDLILNVDQTYHTLYPRAGKVFYNQKPLQFYEDVVKIVDQLVLTKSGKVLVMAKDDFLVTNIDMVVDDILLFDEDYYVLSQGCVYRGSFTTFNRFSFEARTMKLKHQFTPITWINNVLSMCSTQDELIFLKTNGEVYNLGLDLIGEKVKQIASNQNHYKLLYEHESGKLVSGNYTYLVMDEETEVVDVDLNSHKIPIVAHGFYEEDFAVLIKDNQLIKIMPEGESIVNIKNPIRVYPSTKQNYYVIADV